VETEVSLVEDRTSILRSGASPILRPSGVLVRSELEEARDAAQGMGEIRKGFTSALHGMSAGTRAGDALLQARDGDDQAAATRQSALRAQEVAAAYAPRVQSLEQVNGLGDVVDLAAGAVGSGVASTLPSLAGALVTRGRGKFRKPGAYAGALVPAYDQEFGEAASTFLNNENVADLPPEEQIAAARGKALANAGLEAIIPGRVASRARRGVKQVGRDVLRDSAGEAVTETLQQGVGITAEKYLDPTKEYSALELADAATQGFFGGGGISLTGAALQATPDAVAAAAGKGADILEAGAARRAARDPEGPAPSGAPVDLDDSPQKGPVEGFSAFRDSVGQAAENLAERVNLAKEGQPTPREFMDRVFGGDDLGASVEAVDLEDIDNPNLRGATREETEANLKGNDRSRILETARVAKEMLLDPDTHPDVRERINSMAGEFGDRVDQSFVTGVAKAKRAAQTSRAAAEDFIGGAKDVFAKHNLMEPTEGDTSAIERAVFQNLTAEARANPEIRANLPLIAEKVAQLSTIKEEADIPSWAYELTELVEDIPALEEAIGADGALLAALQKGAPARTDDSFLRASLDPQATEGMSDATISRLARAVDTLGDMPQAEAEAMREVLNVAFGSPATTMQVLRFYNPAGQNGGVEFAESADTTATPEQQADAEEQVASGDLTEADTQNLDATFRAPNPDRPYLSGRDDEAVAERLAAAGSDGREAKLSEAIALTDETPVAAATRIRSDLEKRTEASAGRDTASVKARIELIKQELPKIIAKGQALREQIQAGEIDVEESGIEALREEVTGYREELKDLPKRKTEDRQDLPALREELARLDALKLTPKEMTEVAALPDEEGKRLKQEILSKRMLEEYSTVLVEKQENAATDTQMKQFRQLLDRIPNVSTGTAVERADKKTKKQDIMRTRIKFTRAKGAPVHLSAESMVYNSNIKQGTIEQKFAESVASVLARPEITGMEAPADTTLITRSSGTTYADIARGEPEARTLTDKERGIIKKAADRKAFGAAHFRADLIDNRAKLRAAMRKVQKERLLELLGLKGSDKTAKQLFDALPPGKDKDDTGAELREHALQVAIRWRVSLDKREGHAGAQKRILEEYIDRVVDETPGAMPPAYDRSEARDQVEKVKLGDEYADPSNVLATELHVDDTIAALQVRRERVKDIPSMVEEIDKQIKDLEAQLDKALAGKKREDIDTIANTVGSTAKPDKPKKPKQEAAPKQKKSEMEGSEVAAPPTDQEQAIEEILRTRGKDVEIEFSTMAEIGGRGSSSYRKLGDGEVKRIIGLAIDSGNMKSTAWHESLHDFIATLGNSPGERRVKQALVRTAASPDVRRRLKHLLKDHPKALEQIASDPEERAAYMYQFWAEGLLELNQTVHPVFERLQDFFQRVAGIVSQERRTADILSTFHAGYFSNPNTTAQVIDRMRGEVIGGRLEQLAPETVRAGGNLMTSATNGLRDYQNKHITKLAGMFHPADGSPGFIQRRHQQEGKWENDLGVVIGGATAAEQKVALRNLQAMKAPSSPLEKRLVKFFKDAHAYMLEAGVGSENQETGEFELVRQIERYFPRRFDRSKIAARRKEWEALLSQYLGDEQVQKVTESLERGTGQIDLAATSHDLGFTPFAEGVIDRQLTFINESNAAEFAEFQHTDLADIALGYTKQMVHRAEFTRAFGPSGETLETLIKASEMEGKDLADVEKKVRALEGTLGADISPSMKEAASWAITAENVILLPLTLASQVIDPLMLAARSEKLQDAGKAYVTAVKRLGRAMTGDKSGVDGEEMARTLGIISNDTALEAMGASYGSMQMSQGARQVSRQFFKWNGMQGWNNSMRIAATVAGERYILSKKDDKRAMAELGLKASDVKTNDKGRLDVSSPAMQEAMFAFVDGAVLRPSAGHRPAWMSDPRFAIVGHLKQFTFAMHNVALARAGREMAENNYRPAAMLALNMPVILAADIAKMAMLSSVPTDWSFMDYVGHAMSRSGLLGTGEFTADAVGDAHAGRVPGESLLGPTLEHAVTALRWIAGDAGTTSADMADRSIPLARYA